MMSASLAPIAGKLAPIVARLDTEHDGERLACVAVLERLLHRHGLRFVDLGVALEAALAPHEQPESSADISDQDLVQRARSADWLSSWERRFVGQVAQRLAAGHGISPRQREILAGIVAERCF